MSYDYGGWMWAFIDVLLVLILGCGMAYGVIQWRRFKRLSRKVKAQRDAATERLIPQGMTIERLTQGKSLYGAGYGVIAAGRPIHQPRQRRVSPRLLRVCGSIRLRNFRPTEKHGPETSWRA